MSEYTHMSKFRHDEHIDKILGDLENNLQLSRSEVLRLLVVEHGMDMLKGSNEHVQQLRKKHAEIKEEKRKERLDNIDMIVAKRKKKEAEFIKRTIHYLYELNMNGADKKEMLEWLHAHDGMAERAGHKQELDDIIDMIENNKIHKVFKKYGSGIKRMSKYKSSKKSN